ncbi:hypothetical protein HYX70_00960 [Candidatus Saccharibacteria bacterium]|nr:hypothetical protein [Candidatus Saccharibacteria bacterium]
MADSAEQAKRIDEGGKQLDYEQEALASIVRSWELDDKECQALALADAQVWATLHLARVTANGLEV